MKCRCSQIDLSLKKISLIFVEMELLPSGYKLKVDLKIYFNISWNVGAFK